MTHECGFLSLSAALSQRTSLKPYVLNPGQHAALSFHCSSDPKRLKLLHSHLDCVSGMRKRNRKFGILCRSESQILAEPLLISLWNEVENDTNWMQLQNTSPEPQRCCHQTFPSPFIKCAPPLSRREKAPRPHLLSGPETDFSINRDSALQTSTTSCQCCSAVTDAPCFHYKQVINFPCVHSGMVPKPAQDCLLGVAERPSGTHL